MIITTQCPFCRRKSELIVDDTGYHNWQTGMLIQNAFPHLTPDQRESLITGICPRCWDETFGEPDTLPEQPH